MDISSRLLRLLKAATSDKVGQISQIMEQGEAIIDDFLEEWERKHGIHDSQAKNKHTYQQTKAHHKKESGFQNKQTHQEKKDTTAAKSPYPKEILDDLYLFGLKPPVTFDEIKKARNREIKKFHPDKFLNDPEKMETAKQIVQIYNAAFDRLEQKLK